MNRLLDDPTVGEVKAFLAAVEPKTDADRPSKLNPSLTRREIWQVFMDAVNALKERGKKDSDPVYDPDWATHAPFVYLLTGDRVRGRPRGPAWRITVRNINREFGSRRRG